jgi:CRP/FNR family cyclic AMP-dependent transcriptional regulator
MSTTPHRFGIFRHAGQSTVHTAGEVIFREGDPGSTMFAIKRGRVAVQLDGTTIDTMGEGEIFGEIAVLDHGPRSATVLALEETELVEIDEEHLLFLTRQNPYFALELMRVLCDRIRQGHALSRSR